MKVRCSPVPLSSNLFVGFIIMYFISGLVSLYLGCWLSFTKSDYDRILSHDFGISKWSFLCIFIGLFVVVIGCVGFLSMYTNRRSYLKIFFIATIFVLATEVFIAMLLINRQVQVERHVENELSIHFQTTNFTTGTNSTLFASEVTWDHLQQEFKCCGITNYTNWYYDDFRWPKNRWVPDSCCNMSFYDVQDPESYHGCGKLGRPEILYSHGCHRAFTDWLHGHTVAIGMIIFVMAIIQSFALLTCLVVYYRKKPTRRRSEDFDHLDQQELYDL